MKSLGLLATLGTAVEKISQQDFLNTKLILGNLQFMILKYLNLYPSVVYRVLRHIYIYIYGIFLKVKL